MMCRISASEFFIFSSIDVCGIGIFFEINFTVSVTISDLVLGT